eukprot:160044_1
MANLTNTTSAIAICPDYATMKIPNESTSIAPYEWITITSMNIIATFINILILHKEVKIRQDHNKECSKKHNSWFKSFSLLTMVSGILYTFIAIFKHTPHVCIIVRLSLIAIIVCQQVAMGFYQLSRLYYCFAKSKVHSNKGYPHYLFKIMYAFGILIILISILFPVLSCRFAHCGMTPDFRYYPKDEFLLADQFVVWKILPIMYVCWDVLTLLLYVVKVCTFKKHTHCQKIEVYNRIMFILRRVLILTIFYEIPVFLNIVIIFIYRKKNIGTTEKNNGLVVLRITYFFLWGLTSIFLNISMFLMQQHNDNRYRRFLQTIQKLCTKSQMNIVCCCFKYSLADVLELDLQYLADKRRNRVDQNSPVSTGDSAMITQTAKSASLKQIHSLMVQLSKHTSSEETESD